jgi:murein DD-endopeptidase MepM/ murein hydrolase activator NlpD
VKGRKLFLLLSAVLIVVLLISGWTEVERLAGKLLFYARVAELYVKRPDAELLMPIKEVKTRQIANTWHVPRAGDRLHEGQDIFAAKDTPIYSATVGYVLRIGENDLGGHTVSVIGAGGRVYYYAHLDAYAPEIAEGNYVDTETVLGYVGTTGNAKGGPPHLHFGVYTRQGAIDPLPLLKNRAE